MIPDKVEIFGTVRAESEELKRSLMDDFETMVVATARGTGLEAVLEWERNPYPAVINTEEETRLALSVATETFGSENVERSFPPMMGGEDFAFMLNEKPGCFAFLGNGRTGEKGGNGLHTAKYDFNDDLIPYGVRYWTGMARRLLGTS